MLTAGSRELLAGSESTQPEVDKLLPVVTKIFKILSDPCDTKISKFSAKNMYRDVPNGRICYPSNRRNFSSIKNPQLSIHTCTLSPIAPTLFNARGWSKIPSRGSIKGNILEDIPILDLRLS